MKDTFIPTNSSVKAQWFVIDAQDECLGRLATKVVKILRGKTKVFYDPSKDVGDYVIILNAKKSKYFWQQKYTKNLYEAFWSTRWQNNRTL